MNKLAAIIDRISRDAALNVAFVGMTVALIFVSWLGIAYMQSTLYELERNIAKREAMLERGHDFHASSQRLKEQLHSVKSTLHSLQAKLPDTPEESQFLRELSERAMETGVSLSDFRPGGVAQRPHCKDIELRLRGAGPYANICRWIDGFDDLPRLVRISQITIAGPATTGEDCHVDIQLSLVFGTSAQQPLAASVKP